MSDSSQFLESPNPQEFSCKQKPILNTALDSKKQT